MKAALPRHNRGSYFSFQSFGDANGRSGYMVRSPSAMNRMLHVPSQRLRHCGPGAEVPGSSCDLPGVWLLTPRVSAFRHLGHEHLIVARRHTSCADERDATHTRPAPPPREASQAQSRFAEKTNQIMHKDLPGRPSLLLPECSRRLVLAFRRRISGVTRRGTTQYLVRNNRSARTNGEARAARRREGESPGYSGRTSRFGRCW
jgi:hypothetical protein